MLQRFEIFDEFDVGREPTDGGEFGGCEPFGSFVFKERDVTFQTAQETMHRQVKSRIVVVDGSEQFAHFDLGSQFFTDLALKGLFPSLTCFDFTSRELPPVFLLAVASLGCEDASILITDDGSDDFDCFSFGCHGHYLYNANCFSNSVLNCSRREIGLRISISEPYVRSC